MNKNERMKSKEVSKQNCKKTFCMGCMLVAAFIFWTILIQWIDVKPVGQNGTDIGFSTLNMWFHKMTGVHMMLYVITDWLGLVPIFICMIFGGIGLIQLAKRRSLFKVDCDMIILGIYYVLVIFCYLLFEMIPINYRPILIDGIMEASYPSSTTLLVLCVMPTLIDQANRRLEKEKMKKVIRIFTICFSIWMILGRLLSGVHWLTDIIGSLLLSAGLFYIYKAVILMAFIDRR